MWVLVAWLWLLVTIVPQIDGAKMCPLLCSCRNDELAAECPNAQLDMVPWTLHPRLRSLSLRGNHLRQLSGSSFSSYSDLRSLDLSDTQLINLGRNVFLSLHELELLDLSSNMLADVDNTTFEGLTQLNQLDLSFNYIEHIPAGTFQHLAQLQRLDLAHNRIKQLEEVNVFRGVKKLRVLSLRSNELSSIPTNAFRNLGDLAFLDLGLNDISDLSAEAFLPLRTLEELRLDGCKLQTVRPGAFRGLGSLRILKLQDNLLTDTPSDSFSDIPRLEEIDVGQNPIDRLRDRAFQHLRHLRVLGISGATEMHELDPNALIDNQQLEQLSLSHNVRLTQLDPATFRPLSKLHKINLRANGLTSLPIDLLSLAWEELTELDIRDNPFVCNCSLRWLLAKRRPHFLPAHGQGPAFSSALTVSSVAAPPAPSSPPVESISAIFANDTTRIKCVAPSHLAGIYLDEVETEESLECSAWPFTVRLGVFRAALGALLVLVVLSTTTCCLRNRSKISFPLPYRRRLSPNGACASNKPLGGSEWLQGSASEKVEYLFAQTRLPSNCDPQLPLQQQQQQQHQHLPTSIHLQLDGGVRRQSSAADMTNSGVFVCQLPPTTNTAATAATASTQAQPIRFLPQQNLPSPDLLDLCRNSPELPHAMSYSGSIPRHQPSGLTTVKASAAAAPSASVPAASRLPQTPASIQTTPSFDRDQLSHHPPFCYYFE